MTSTKEKHDALFASIIAGYGSQAMVAMGKMASPISGNIERDLDQARVMIDLIEMLEAKTQGNRSQAETDAIQQTLSTLRLNFVEEVNKPEPETDAEAGDPESESNASPEVSTKED